MAQEASKDIVKRRPKIGLICSSGGHLIQLHSLKSFWSQFERFWVVYPTSDAKSLLNGERVHWIGHQAARNTGNFIKDFPFALRVLRAERPQMLLTTGARIAVPFFYLGRVMGMKLVYLETVSRIHKPSLAFRLAAPVAHERLVQWRELTGAVKGSRYEGGVLDLFDRR